MIFHLTSVTTSVSISAAHGYFGRLIFQYASFNNSRSLHFFLAAWPVIGIWFTSLGVKSSILEIFLRFQPPPTEGWDQKLGVLGKSWNPDKFHFCQWKSSAWGGGVCLLLVESQTHVWNIWGEVIFLKFSEISQILKDFMEFCFFFFKITQSPFLHAICLGFLKSAFLHDFSKTHAICLEFLALRKSFKKNTSWNVFYLSIIPPKVVW